LYQKPQLLNQTSFFKSYSPYSTATFQKVTAHSYFFKSHSPTKHTLINLRFLARPPCVLLATRANAEGIREIICLKMVVVCCNRIQPNFL
ncbi:Os06g0612001, partial [Oryza sativa Japonica Group]